MKKRKISIIDNSANVVENVQESICQNLRNVTIDTFIDPNHALNHISEHNGNDLVLISCTFNEMSGKDLYNGLRQAGIRTPVCFFSDDESVLSQYKALASTYTWNCSRNPDELKDFVDRIAVIMSEYRNSRDIEGLSVDVDEMKGLLNRILNKLDELENKIEEKSNTPQPSILDPLTSLYQKVVKSDKAKAVKWFLGGLWKATLYIGTIGFFLGKYLTPYIEKLTK